MQHVDAALTALVRSAVPGSVELRFDPPGRDLLTSGEAISLFLHRIVEDVAARAASWTDELDERGRVLARVLPPRRYRFCYLITAWATDRAAEHRRLGDVLAALAPHLHVPAEYLPPALRDGPPVDLDVAHPELPGVASDLWTSLRMPPRTGLDVVLSLTTTPVVVAPLDAPPSTVDLGAHGGVPEPARPSTVADPPRRQIRE
jgi:Pvc16 N-terminal domain